MSKQAKADIGETEPEKNATPNGSNEKARRPRAWCVVRIVDYRMQALAQASDDPDDQTLEWCDLGGDTLLSTDRESMFQAARRHQGLLMSANGLPSPGRMAKFSERVKELEGVIAAANNDANAAF